LFPLFPPQAAMAAATMSAAHANIVFFIF